MMKRRKKSGRRHASHIKDIPKSDANDTPGTEEDIEDDHPYRIKNSSTMGRYLVASRDLTPGDVIISEEPIVVGPCQESKPMCLGCYVDIDLNDETTFVRCAACSWPLCSQHCSGLHQQHGHSTHECRLLSRAKIQPSAACYYAVTPLRCLALKESNTDTWDHLLTMESHDDKRRAVEDLWSTNQKLAVEKIRSLWGFTEFSEEEIQKTCGVLEVNAFEVRSSGPQPLRAVYPRAFLFSHDCVPNTSHSDGGNFKLTVRAAQVIPKNETLTVSYTYTLQSTLQRRKHLQKTKFFSCHCRRCCDPTELGTYAGALRCRLCKDGLILPLDPLNEDSDWKCILRTCRDEPVPAAFASALTEKLFGELDSVDGNDIAGFEEYLNKYNNVLHENHYLRLAALHCLSQLYGKISGYIINELADEQLERKIEICRRLLKVFDKLEPRFSKQRGLLLYELQAPLMILITRRQAKQNIPKKELRAKLQEVAKCLEESYKILSYEPENSPEARTADVARQALLSLVNRNGAAGL